MGHAHRGALAAWLLTAACGPQAARTASTDASSGLSEVPFAADGGAASPTARAMGLARSQSHAVWPMVKSVLSAAEGTSDAACAVSPFAASTLLAMLAQLADGASAPPLAAAAGGGADVDLSVALPELAQGIRAAADAGGAVLSTATRLFPAANVATDDALAKPIRTQFLAPPAKLSYFLTPATCLDQIQRWGREQTRGQLAEIVPDTAVTGDTLLVSTSGLGIDAPFASDLTVEAQEGSALPGMKARAPLAFYQDADVTALRLPVAGGRFAVVACLPQTDNKTLLDRWDAATIDRLADPNTFTPRDVDLTMPVVDVSTRIDLAAHLAAQGVPSSTTIAVFSSRAPIPVGALWHQARLHLDAKGLNTTRSGVARPAPLTPAAGAAPVTVGFDRPFLFLVVEEQTGSWMFAGRTG